MEKKTECEIVQDLLLGYVDDILNVESKKLVEKHLLNCSVCQKRLEDIKNDLYEAESTQKKEINYLKKIKMKARIKSVLMAFGIIFLLLFVFYLYKFTIVSTVSNRAQKALLNDNFYRETRQNISDKEVLVTKEYFKGGNYKEIFEIYSENGMSVQKVVYGNINSNEIVSILESEKKVLYKSGDFEKLYNSNKVMSKVPLISDINKNLLVKLCVSFVASITTDNYDVGREYYVFKNQFESTQRWELWVDKKTGLPIREINRDARKTFFEDSNSVVQTISDNIQEYIYEFDIVTDEDVKIPDLSSYIIEKSDTIDII